MVAMISCTQFTIGSVLPLLRVGKPHHRRTCPARQVMARNRILITPSEVQDSHSVRFGAHDDRAKHILQILKLEPGDCCLIGIINGAMGQATVAQISPQVVLECQHWVQPLPTPQLYLVLAMPRPKVMRRLWSTLACLGISRVYITGAEKVEKAYFGARILEPRAFIKELIIEAVLLLRHAALCFAVEAKAQQQRDSKASHDKQYQAHSFCAGAEQAGDTRLPAVFFSRSVKATMASLAPTFATNTASSHKFDAGEVQILNSGQVQTPSANLVQTLHAGQTPVINTGQIQTLLAEGATGWDTSQSNSTESAVQQQSNSISYTGQADTRVGRLTDPPNGSLGLLPYKDDNKNGTTAVGRDAGKHQAGSTACVAAESAIAPSAAKASSAGGSRSYADCTGTRVVKLLAHTEGGVSVQQAVLNHFNHWHESDSTAADLPDDIHHHTGLQGLDELQVSRSELSAPFSYLDGCLQHGSADRRPVAVLAVGPEGGWTPSELALLTEEHAFQVVTTAGGRTLDTTTAVISLASLVGEAMSAYSDQQTS